MATLKTKGRMAKTGLGIGVLLFVLIPLAALATEYTSLATINRGLTYPTDMAVSSENGIVYVVDGLSSRVLTYDGNYRYQGSISAVESPVAVAVSPAGTVYIADNKTKSVKIIDPSSGQITGSLMKDGAMATFKLPRNIAVGPDNVVYVVDQLADSIEIFSAAGIHTGSVAGLAKPQDAVASATELLIIDQPLVQDGTSYGASSLNGSRIQVYSLAQGAIVTDHAFPSFGNKTANGEYISLKGIGIDSQGYIYVSDSFLQVVYKYSPAMTVDNGDGTTSDITLGTFSGPINDGFATPLGMTVSADGRLFVTSSFDGIVKVLGVDALAGVGTWMNEAPVADAGADQTVAEGQSFVLDGSGSSDSDGIHSYVWTQIEGTPVLDMNPFVTDSSLIDLTAPDVGPEGGALAFRLVVKDAFSKASAASTTEVAVSNVISGSVVINGGALYTNNQLVSLSLDAPEAVEMRFANDNDPLSGPYTYSSSGSWTLSAYDPSIEANEKTVNVEFKDAGGNIAVASSSILLDMQPPAAPGINTGGAAGEFNWSPVDGAASYTLQYSTNSDFTGAVTLTGLTFNELTIALDGLAVGKWFWRVQAVDVAGNASLWSDVGSFVIAPDCSGVPDAPQLALPVDNTGGISRTAIIETNAMIYPADCGTHLRTEWQVSEDFDFSTLVMHVGTTLDNLTVYQIPALVLEPSTAYYWRVRQVATNGKQSAWSEAWSFTTVAAPDETGVDGVLFVQPDGDAATSGDEISIKKPVGDANIKIKLIRVSSGVVAQTVKELDPDAIPDSVNKPASFPLGLMSFKLTVEPEAVAQVEVIFSGRVPADAEWYIYNVDEGWHAYAGAIFSRNRKSVTLNFQDGGIGDADGVANGIIVNP